MTTSDIRERFEKWAEQSCLWLQPSCNGVGTYCGRETELAWTSWQAALSAQAPSVAVREIQTMLDEHEGGSRRRNEQSFDLGYFDGYRDAAMEDRA